MDHTLAILGRREHEAQALTLEAEAAVLEALLSQYQREGVQVLDGPRQRAPPPTDKAAAVRRRHHHTGGPLGPK